jgi:hypothetical protein
MFSALIRNLKIKSFLVGGLESIVNPDRYLKELKLESKFNKLLSNLVGAKLIYKLWQFPRQMSSAVAAFNKYEYKTGKPNFFRDALMWNYDYWTSIFNPEDWRKAKEMSAEFYYRMKEKDAMRLFTGIPTGRQDLSDLKEALHKPTKLGDAAGVMGYYANYKRNIRNGMNPDQARRDFAEFNRTQQDTSGMFLSWVARARNPMMRSMMAFTSPVLLMINNSFQHGNNVLHQAFNPNKKIKAEDTRGLLLNLSMLNFAFTAISYIGKILFGDDDDQEEAVDEILKSAMPVLGLLSRIPYVGMAAQEFNDALVYGGKSLTNDVLGTNLNTKSKEFYMQYDLIAQTFIDIAKGFRAMISEDWDNKSTQKKMLKGGTGAVEAATGISPRITKDIYDAIKIMEDEDGPTWNMLMMLLGISKTYRPEEQVPMVNPEVEPEETSKPSPSRSSRGRSRSKKRPPINRRR